MSRKFTERREFGPTLGWYSLPIVGEARQRRHAVPVTLIAVAFIAAITLVLVVS